MAKRIILPSMLLALAAVAQSASTPEQTEETRETCIRKAADNLAGFAADEDVARLIEQARTNYQSRTDIADYQVPETPGCANVQRRLDQMYDQVPCFADLDLMGVDHSDAILEMVQSDATAKGAIEAFFACEGGLLSFKLMEIMGVMPAYEDLHTGPGVPSEPEESTDEP